MTRAFSTTDSKQCNIQSALQFAWYLVVYPSKASEKGVICVSDEIYRWPSWIHTLDSSDLNRSEVNFGTIGIINQRRKYFTAAELWQASVPTSRSLAVLPPIDLRPWYEQSASALWETLQYLPMIFFLVGIFACFRWQSMCGFNTSNQPQRCEKTLEYLLRGKVGNGVLPPMIFSHKEYLLFLGGNQSAALRKKWVVLDCNCAGDVVRTSYHKFSLWSTIDPGLCRY